MIQIESANEIWKDVVGYEGLYKVSNLGNVYGVKRKIILKPAPNEKGYMYVGLSKNNHLSSKEFTGLLQMLF